MIGERRLARGRLAGIPRHRREILRSHFNGACVVDCLKRQLSAFHRPRVGPDRVHTCWIVEQLELIARYGVRRRVLPIGDEMMDAEHALVEIERPHSAFQPIVRASTARRGRGSLWIEFHVRAVDRG